MKNFIPALLSIPVTLVLLFAIACHSHSGNQNSKSSFSGDLIIFHAGSLSVPFREMAEAFEKEFPEVNVLLESAGSVACARKITELDRSCDIIASADYRVIDNLLIPDFAKWNIRFAGNEMVIVYNDQSHLRKQIDSSNWFQILLDPDVIYGRSDPEQDPCGYRTVLTAKLAEKYYHIPGLADQLLEKNQEFIRPKEVDLLALLETHTIDYCFNYRSVALQHNLLYILLPDEINLKNPVFADLYSTVNVEIAGQTPDKKIIQTGEPMVYGATILTDAPNPEAAEAFMEFLLSENKGMKILRQNGQTTLIPALTSSRDQLPEQLKKYVENSDE